jgi:hypothetical protein
MLIAKTNCKFLPQARLSSERKTQAVMSRLPQNSITIIECIRTHELSRLMLGMLSNATSAERVRPGKPSICGHRPSLFAVQVAITVTPPPIAFSFQAYSSSVFVFPLPRFIKFRLVSTTFLASLALHLNTLYMILLLDTYSRKGYQETHRSFSATLLVTSLSGCQYCPFVRQLTGAHHFSPNDIPLRKIFVGGLYWPRLHRVT